MKKHKKLTNILLYKIRSEKITINYMGNKEKRKFNKNY